MNKQSVSSTEIKASHNFVGGVGKQTSGAKHIFQPGTKPPKQHPSNKQLNKNSSSTNINDAPKKGKIQSTDTYFAKKKRQSTAQSSLNAAQNASNHR